MEVSDKDLLACLDDGAGDGLQDRPLQLQQEIFFGEYVGTRTGGTPMPMEALPSRVTMKDAGTLAMAAGDM